MRLLSHNFEQPHIPNPIFIENATYPMKKRAAQLAIVSTQPINDLKVAELFLWPLSLVNLELAMPYNRFFKLIPIRFHPDGS
jgi:hypothetical protein